MGSCAFSATILQDLVFLTNLFNRKARQVGAENAEG